MIKSITNPFCLAGKSDDNAGGLEIVLKISQCSKCLFFEQTLETQASSISLRYASRIYAGTENHINVYSNYVSFVNCKVIIVLW